MKPHVLLFLPTIRERVGGGAVAMWRLMEALERYGCRVTAAAQDQHGPTVVHGRPVMRNPVFRDMRDVDVVLTVGRCAHEAVRLSRGRKVSVLVFMHSVARRIDMVPPGIAGVVWGSQAMKDYAARELHFQTRAPQYVAWPVIEPETVRTLPGDRVTLVNLIPEKGGDLFWRLAERLPQVEFLAVEGGWRKGHQVIPADVPDNVEVIPFQPDPREVFKRTKVLLYPKGAKAGPGWMHGVGMTALEAACSGIPTIAFPGPGLVESLGEAGTFVASTKPEPWVSAIERMMEPDRWAECSARALDRSRILDPGKIAESVLSFANISQPVAA